MAWDDQHRFQELNSSNEGLGLIMDNTGFVSDELYFNDGRSRFTLPREFDVTQYQVVEDSEEEEEEESSAIQVSGRDQQEHLVQRAMARIDRAKATGKPMVNFTHEEIEALEYRRANTSPERRSRAKKSSSNSPKRDHSNGAWSRKRHSTSRPKSGLFSTILAPPKSRSTGKSTRRRAADESPPQDTYASGSYPPAMIPGSNGAPVYSPLGYYNAYPPAQTVARRAVTSPQAPHSVRTPTSAPRSTSNGQSSYDPTAPPYAVYARDYPQSQSSSRSSSLNHSVNLEQFGRSQSTPNVAPYRVPVDLRHVAQHVQPRRVISEPQYSSVAVSRGPSTRRPISQRLYADGAADEESGSSGEEEDDEDSESEVEVIPVKRRRGAVRHTK
jgi:hypothetical protein